MYDYVSTYHEDTIKRYQALYEKFKGIYHALLFAQDEGVFEIIVRSQAGAVLVPVSLGDGTEIAAMMVENFAKRVDRIESLLNGQLDEVAEERAADRRRGEQRCAAQKAEALEYRAREAAYQTEEGQLAIAREIIARHEAKSADTQAKEGAPAL